jgi:hypothetical protein
MSRYLKNVGHMLSPETAGLYAANQLVSGGGGGVVTGC